MWRELRLSDEQGLWEALKPMGGTKGYNEVGVSAQGNVKDFESNVQTYEIESQSNALRFYLHHRI